jgi:hypothetical protein
MQAQLEQSGWDRYDHKWKNYFTSDGPYRGYNTMYVNKTGQRFELQFHTSESLGRKTLSHSLYSRYRGMSRGPERNNLERQTEAVWTGFNNPANFGMLQGMAMP